LFILFAYDWLPETMPHHINSYGNIDGYGSRDEIWTLPKVGTVLYLVITAFSFIPETFNYLEEVTEENAQSLYRKGVRTIRILKLLTIVFFFVTDIVFVERLYSDSKENKHVWLLMLVPFFFFVPTVYYLFSNNKNQ